MKAILHITTQSAWEDAKRNGSYEPQSLAAEGFIHCSTLRQVVATANAFFRGVTDLVLLVIDESALSAELKYEPPADTAERMRSRCGALSPWQPAQPRFTNRRSCQNAATAQKSAPGWVHLGNPGS